MERLSLMIVDGGVCLSTAAVELHFGSLNWLCPLMPPSYAGSEGLPSETGLSVRMG